MENISDKREKAFQLAKNFWDGKPDPENVPMGTYICDSCGGPIFNKYGTSWHGGWIRCKKCTDRTFPTEQPVVHHAQKKVKSITPSKKREDKTTEKDIISNQNEILQIIFISIFLACATYALIDQIFQFNISAIQLIYFISSYFVLFCIAELFKRMGKNGWEAFIPILNIITLLDIVEKPRWWFFLLLIPPINIVFLIWITNLLAKKCGKDQGFTVGLILLPFIFYPILAFDDQVQDESQ